MASPQITIHILFLILFIKCIKARTIQVKLPEINVTGLNIKSHLMDPKVIYICDHREIFCRSNNINVCAMRLSNGSRVYKDYINTCFLFMSNMCENPADEFYIVSSGYCEHYLARRRNDDMQATKTFDNSTEHANDVTEDHLETTTEYISDTTTENNENQDITTEPGILRKNERSTLYSVDESYDWHKCPRSCPNIYKPECLNVNRSFGKYFKFMLFINHCETDLYYCKHPEEFDPPPDESEEHVQNSLLSWSHCGAAKFLQLSRFVEVANSMGRYGWLAGDFKPTHIMEPHERIPGYGK